MKHTLEIPDWHPATVNQLLGNWKKAMRLKRIDKELVEAYVWCDRIPRASGKRRVSLEIVLWPRQRAGDPDAYWKSLLDALKAAGAIVDDNRQHVELSPVTFSRGPRRRTRIVLEDV